jgi:hypothetical protein
MFRDGDMYDAPAIMSEQSQDEQQPARRCRDDKEVGRDQLRRVVRARRSATSARVGSASPARSQDRVAANLPEIALG